MIFSDLFKYTSVYPVFSPNGQFLAIVVNYKLIIKEIKSMQIFKVYSCVDSIFEIKWSQDSLFILCVLKKRNIVQVWSLEYSEWQCKINEGSAGLFKCDWCPDSRHILTTLDFFIRITLWSIEDENVAYMKYPKNCSKYYDFSSDGKLFALAERRNFKDYISIFKTNRWNLLKNFLIATSDLDGLKWVNYSNLICWDSCLRSTNIMIYNLNGELLKSMSKESTGFQLGIKQLQYHPSSQLIVIGSYNSFECQIINVNNLKLITNINCSLESTKKSRFHSKTNSEKLIYYENDNGTYDISSRLDGEIGLGKFSSSVDKKFISDIQFSFDGLYFSTRFENEPNVLLIWSVRHISLCTVLIHKASIKSVAWCRNSVYLALVTGNDRLYMWTLKGSVSVKVPDTELTELIEIVWNPTGSCLCLSSKISSCIMFLDDHKICDNIKL